MIIGVPKEIKEVEKRVGMTPQGVDALVAHGHRVLVERGAGEGSGFSDQEFRKAGATLVEEAKDVWEGAGMVVKVKEPPGAGNFSAKVWSGSFCISPSRGEWGADSKIDGASDCRHWLRNRPGARWFASSSPADERDCGKGLGPCGGDVFERRGMGAGEFSSCGASGVPPAKVVILGAGVVGANACKVALGIGARVSILDIHPERLSYLHDITQGHIATFISNRMTIGEEIAGADLVIGAVLIPGAHAPKLVTRPMLRRMRPGSAVVDVSVDQGGCFETTRPTTHEHPTYIEEGIVHYCVANIPGAFPENFHIRPHQRDLPLHPTDCRQRL